jgi:hypothetical protein
LAEAALNLINYSCGVLNTGSSLRAYMQNKLAAVRIREKILAKKRNQSERKETDNYEARNKDLSRWKEA